MLKFTIPFPAAGSRLRPQANPTTAAFSASDRVVITFQKRMITGCRSPALQGGHTKHTSTPECGHDLMFTNDLGKQALAQACRHSCKQQGTTASMRTKQHLVTDMMKIASEDAPLVLPVIFRDAAEQVELN